MGCVLWTHLEGRHTHVLQLRLGVYLRRSPISWCAKRIDSTSLDVCEAELMAIQEATTQAIHLQSVLEDLGEVQITPTMVHTDSKAPHDSLHSENFS